MIEKKPFRQYSLDEEKGEFKHKVVPIKCNKNELAELKELKKLLQQDKSSVALKQAMSITLELLTSNTSKILLHTICGNQRRNRKYTSNAEENNLYLPK